jgi:tripartite-type tricarboxylate transporter receptor subunit TctC
VIVENHAGADGLIGTQRALNAPADGYTILMQLNQMLLWKWTLPTARVDLLTDFRLVSKIQHSPMAISVAAKVPGNTLKEFFAECQKSDLPCSFGSATANASLVGRQLMELGGVKNAVQVPYKGTAPMMTDLLGGHLKMGIPSASSGIPHLKNGTIKILAVGGVRRFPALPNVPTLEESGFNVLGDTWYGLMVARGTPNDVFEAIVTAVQSVSKKPELLAIIESNGGLPVFSTPAEFTEDVRRESDYLAPLGARYLKGP